MQQIPTPPTAEISVGMSLPIFLILACCLGGALAFALSRTSPQARLKLSLVVAAGFLAIGIALSFWCLTPQRTFTLPQPPFSPISRQIVESPKVVEPQPFEAVSPALESREAVTDAMTPPEWTAQKLLVDGNRTLIVVKSGRFASREEAESTAFDEAVAAATHHFRELDPRRIGDRLVTHLAPVRQAVKQRFEEIAEHDFGKFKAPMYQVWLQLELTPEIGEQIAAPWRAAAIEARLRTLGGWAIGLTGAAAALAFALRLDAAWNGRRRAGIVVATIALALGGLAILG